jgi:hypothetical protein
MPRPPLEVADIIRAAGDSFLNGSQWLTWQHRKVLNAILACRTAALGGHVDECSRCGHRVISFNSCRNRHCPKCQANARDRWLAARSRDLLPTPYVFRGKFVAGLRQLYENGALRFSGKLAHLRTARAFAAWLRSLFRSDWVVYSKPRFGRGGRSTGRLT